MGPQQQKQQKQAVPIKKPSSPSPSSSNQKKPPMIPPVNPAQNKPPPLPPGTVPSMNESNGPGAVPPPIPKQQQQPPPQPKQPQQQPPPQPKQQQQRPPAIPSNIPKPKQQQPPPPIPQIQQKKVDKPPPPIPSADAKKNDGPGAVNKEWPNKAANQIDIFIVSEGAGSVPSAASAVEIEYSGHLPDGKQFIKHREVIQLGKKQNIKGLEQAVTKIKVGSEIKLWIPSRLAYGARGAGALIPPNSDLTFHLQLHRIVTQ